MFNFLTGINSTSYGICGYNLCRTLSGMDINYSLFICPHDKNLSIGKEQETKFIREALQRAHYYNPDFPCVRLWHQHSLAQYVGKGIRVGFPIFELDKFNAIEKHHLSSVDRLFVCSQWAADIISANGIAVDTRIVNLGVDRTIFRETPQDRSGTYKFLNVGKLEVRKGHDILPALFNKAFSPSDDVELHVAFTNTGLSREEHLKWMKTFTNTPLGPKIKFIHRLETQREIADLLSLSNCLIQPSRAEGWNLPLLEAMSCNRPVITTNYSAHTEFCTPSNSFLVDINEFEPAYDGRYFFGQGNWARIGSDEMDKFVEYMRYCYENRIETNAAGIETAERFSWNNSCHQLLMNLQ